MPKILYVAIGLFISAVLLSTASFMMDDGSTDATQPAPAHTSRRCCCPCQGCDCGEECRCNSVRPCPCLQCDPDKE